MISIPECTLCGKVVDRLFLAEVEGSEIEVCEECGKFGKVVKEIRPRKEKENKFIVKKEVVELEESEEELKPNYGDLIIHARQKAGLERKEFAMEINEKESIIRRLELQQMVPNDKLKKKIEDFLDIKLTEVYKKKKIQSSPAKGTLTLGDIIEIK